jgi:hypothetical protein
LIQQTSLLIYDEITMQHRHCQEAFDCTCRDIHDSDMPFGGLTVVTSSKSSLSLSKV